MSDSNKKTTTQQVNQGQPSHYELARAHTKQGLQKSAAKHGEISQGSTPHTGRDAAMQIGRAASAGAKDFGKAGYHAGMGFMQGVSQQNPNSGQQLNNMRINQAIAQGRQSNQQSAATNKGIEAARQKSSASGAKPSQSTNKGIASYQSRASGQSSGVSKSSAGGSSKGSSAGSGKSGGSSSGSSQGISR